MAGHCVSFKEFKWAKWLISRTMMGACDYQHWITKHFNVRKQMGRCCLVDQPVVHYWPFLSVVHYWPSLSSLPSRISHQLDSHLWWNLQSPLLLCWSQWALMAMTLDRHLWELEMTSMWQRTSYWKHSLVELTYCNFIGQPSRAELVSFQDEQTIWHVGLQILPWFGVVWCLLRGLQFRKSADICIS
jgi:hypothetical protein